MIQGVIEYLCLQKEKVGGFSRFISADLANGGEESVVKIPIHVEYVEDYGSPNSYINIEGIKKFIEWRPEFKDAIFEGRQGTYHMGTFTSKTASMTVIW